MTSIVETVEDDSIGYYKGYSKFVLTTVCRGFKHTRRIPRDIMLTPVFVTAKEIKASLATLKAAVAKSHRLDQESQNSLLLEITEAIEECAW